MSEDPKPNKAPVVRGARACTVCRAAKMKCVSAEDGTGKCQRCQRQDTVCVFEKHRRGRKPGSKLSEASKMLRRLEKGLNNAKLKNPKESYAADMRPIDTASSLTTLSGPSAPSQDASLSLSHSRAGYGYPPQNESHRSPMDIDEDDEDSNNAAIFPAKLIRGERRSFLSTILNPTDSPTEHQPRFNNSYSSPESTSTSLPKRSLPPPGLQDPVASGLISEEDVSTLFDSFFLRLNPFINLFDPSLHTPSYVRDKCPFLFTTMLMAACKFWKPHVFPKVKKLAHDFSVMAFAEQWMRVEVVQAFSCLTYWKDPEDNRTWMYIGYACRMAVELGLNKRVYPPPQHESRHQLLERRNRERTYLVIFVHDRSLSTQTGRQYMLADDQFVIQSKNWHRENGPFSVRPEDVIVAAFVELRRLVAETTDMFISKANAVSGADASGSGFMHSDVNYEAVLKNCNSKLTAWSEHWKAELDKANGQRFHISFISIFRLYVRVFLNSFGIHESMLPGSTKQPSLQSLSACCSSAQDVLKIASLDFDQLQVLGYGQDTVTIMTAYCAVFLLRLLRSPNTAAQLHEETACDVVNLITSTAEAYHKASTLSPQATSAAAHARFLLGLLKSDVLRPRIGGIRLNSLSRGTPPSGSAGSPASNAHSVSLTQPVQGMYDYGAQESYRGPDQCGRDVSDYRMPVSGSVLVHQNEYTSCSETSSGRGSIAHSPIEVAPVSMRGGVPPPTTDPARPSQSPVAPQQDEGRYWTNMFKDMGFQEESVPPLPPHVPLPQSSEGYSAMRESYSESYRQATYEDSRAAYAESRQTFPANSPTFPDVRASYQSAHSRGGYADERPQYLLPSSRHVYGDRPLYDDMSRQSSYTDGSARGAYAQPQQESMRYHQQSSQQGAQPQVQSLSPIATSHPANTLSKPSLSSPSSAQLPRPPQLQLAPVLPPPMGQSSQGMSYPYRAAPWPA